MAAESFIEENQKLLAELADLEPQIVKAIAEIEARLWEETHPPGFFARLFGARTPNRKDDSNDLVYRLGLGGWTNVLFYEPKLEYGPRQNLSLDLTGAAFYCSVACCPSSGSGRSACAFA